jgi:hypothetical protein
MQFGLDLFRREQWVPKSWSSAKRVKRLGVYENGGGGDGIAAARRFVVNRLQREVVAAGETGLVTDRASA